MMDLKKPSKHYLVKAAEYIWDDFYEHSVHRTRESAERMKALLETPESDLLEVEPDYRPAACITEIELYDE
jgi:hypothetical protein